MIFRNDKHGVLFEKEIKYHKGCSRKYAAALFLLTADPRLWHQAENHIDFSGIQFEIVNKSTNPVEVGGKKAAPDEVAMTITTNAQGVATTGPNVLPYGDYLIREKSTNASMLKTFTEEIPVTVAENGKMYTFTAENDVVRGGIAVEKRDSKTGERPQGNADFSGITFEIINSSRNPVEVEGTTYAPDQVVATLITDESGYASTEDEVLPYGTYTLREVATNESMLQTFTEQTVQVREHKETYVVTAENEVVRGGLAQSWMTPCPHVRGTPPSRAARRYFTI